MRKPTEIANTNISDIVILDQPFRANFTAKNASAISGSNKITIA